MREKRFRAQIVAVDPDDLRVGSPHSFGAHLHFERINGAATDPLGYL